MVSSTIITSMLDMLSWAWQLTSTGISANPNTAISVVGTSTVARPEIEKSSSSVISKVRFSVP